MVFTDLSKFRPYSPSSEESSVNSVSGPSVPFIEESAQVSEFRVTHKVKMA